MDTSTELFGVTWKTPIVLAPVGSQKAFQPEGEVAAARAAGVKDHLMILSTVTTSSVEDVTAARGGPIWYQLYPTNTWRITEALVKRAETAGCPVLVLTVDLPAGRNTETQSRFAREDTRDCSTCHPPSLPAFLRRKPMFDGLDLTGVSFFSPGLTWEFVRRLRDITRMKLVIKGIETREDAALATQHGVDGIIVSNHGGRAQEGGRATIDDQCLDMARYYLSAVAAGDIEPSHRGWNVLADRYRSTGVCGNVFCGLHRNLNGRLSGCGF